MKINKDLFLEKLSLASRFISSRLNTSTSLQGVYIKKEKEKIHFYSTNLNYYYHGFLKTEEKEDFDFVIDPKKVIEFLSLLPAGNIEIKKEEKKILISQEKNKGEFPLLPITDFPLINEDEKKKQTITTDFFKKVFPLVFFASSIDESRPVLTGINFVSQDETMQVVATDGFRLSLYNLKNKLPFSSVIIPSSFLTEVARLIKKEEISFSFQEKEKIITFFLGEDNLSSRVIEGEYPPYERVIPQEKKTEIVLEREDFLRNIKLTSVFAREFSNIVILETEEERIKISPKTTEKEVNVNYQEAQIKGEKQKIAFNYRFLIDFLNHLQAKKIIINLLRPDAPAVFKPEGEENYLHIIMPVRIQE
jgi:DNA polymerase-3 subunit beta